MITKTKFKNALESGRVYLSTEIQNSRNGITGYNVYVRDAKTGVMSKITGHSPYWSEKKWCYHCVAWGTSRPLEIILSIGYELGLDFHDIKQRWNYL